VYAGGGDVWSGSIWRTSPTNADKRRLYSHLSLQQLLRRCGDIVLNPDILFAVVSRGTHGRVLTILTVFSYLVEWSEALEMW
jgi:hypothetical protein